MKYASLELSQILLLVAEFHEKYGVGIGSCSQEEMYFRCNLLLEELGELAEAIKERSNIEEEMSDVYYVLAGNIISMGYHEVILDMRDDQPLPQDISFENILVQCSLIAKSIRKKWSPADDNFNAYLMKLHLLAIKMLHALAFKLDIPDLLNSVVYKHKINMSRSIKQVGDTSVISDWDKKRA
jgi:hypothetical protein